MSNAKYTEEDMKAAFLCGFMSSSEGFNGEYPHDGCFKSAWNDIKDVYDLYKKDYFCDGDGHVKEEGNE